MAKTKQQPEDTNVVSLKTLTKSSVWDVQENDIFRMLESGVKDADIRENLRHYIDLIRSAFEIIDIKEDINTVKKAYEKKGYKVFSLKIDDKKLSWGIKKKPILRVTDLTYENIRHISANKLLEVIERNFGGGWDSLSQSVQDIILSGFDISTTTLPKDRLHKKGGMYEKKVDDGFEVLEIAKGNWVEAIFAKLKPEQEKPKMKFGSDEDEEELEDDEDYELPEGMAVGVVFAGADSGASNISLTSAVAVSLGIAIQNIPEGAIISMPMRAAGNSRWRSFVIGSLSGAVEPIGAVAVLLLASLLMPILPYMLAFAAGAMFYVVVEELIPEASSGQHSNLSTIGFAIGFVLMMVLDVVMG